MSNSHETASWERETDPSADEVLESNWLFQLRKERFRSRTSGKSHAYYVVRLADAVNVIATTPEGEIVLVRQFRAGSGADSLEPPGGLLEPGEDPLEAGARELLEETGYQGDRAVLIGSAFTNPSLLDSRIHVISIANARKVAEPEPDPNEELQVELHRVDAIFDMLQQGRFDHALAIMGLFWWRSRENSIKN